jgi:hypothetical protein
MSRPSDALQLMQLKADAVQGGVDEPFPSVTASPLRQGSDSRSC